ncbi:MAG: Fe-S protein assembly co-chaperone HscB [Phycisphaerales bacterium]|nr:Fe-S protein assembly co-chaperone HscB [Phycisphaerales bacterium]
MDSGRTEPRDAFDLLGIPAAFDVDAGAVRRAWLERSAAAHPDRAAGGGDPADAERRSAELNEAKRTLDDAERRASLLLRRLGGPGEKDDRSLPPELLVEYMERREALDEAKSRGDGAGVEDARAWAKGMRAEHERACSRMFAEALADANPNPETLRAIRVELNAWRYAERMLEQVDDVTT